MLVGLDSLLRVLMSELAVTLGILVVPLLWSQYQKHRERKKRDALRVQLERAQEQQPPHPQPTSSLLPNMAAADPSLPLPAQKQSLTPILKFILACLCAHQIWIGWKMYYDRPVNIFTTLDLPVTTLVSNIRRQLLSALGTPHLLS